MDWLQQLNFSHYPCWCVSAEHCAGVCVCVRARVVEMTLSTYFTTCAWFRHLQEVRTCDAVRVF